MKFREIQSTGTYGEWEEDMTLDACAYYCIKEGTYWALWSPDKRICTCCYDPPQETDNPNSKTDHYNRKNTTTNIYRVNGRK